MGQLSKLVEVDEVAAAATAATSAVNGITVDMQGFDGVMFFATIAVANAGNLLKAQEGDTTSPTTDLAGSGVVATTNGQVVLLDVYKPLKRYIRAVLIRAGASSASGQIYAVKYRGKVSPKVAADVATSLVSPIAGTA